MALHNKVIMEALILALSSIVSKALLRSSVNSKSFIGSIMIVLWKNLICRSA